MPSTNMRRELNTGFRLLVMILVFLAMSCDADGGGDGCGGDGCNTDGLITGCSDGCGTGMRPIGDGCLGSCLFGGDGGCNDCGAGEGCIDMGDCGDCGDCGGNGPYDYGNGQVVEGAIQVNVTNSLFQFVNDNMSKILIKALGDSGGGDIAVDENGWVSFCLPKKSKPSGFAGMEACTHAGVSACGGGCQIRAHLGDLVITPHSGNRVRIRANIDGVSGKIGMTVRAAWIPVDCTVTLSRTSGPLYLEIEALLPINGIDKNMEVYLGGDHLSINKSGLGMSGCATNVLEFLGITDLIVGQLVDGIGAVSCRGCNTVADCGKGATQCRNKVCMDNSGRMCQGIQLGMEAGVDASSLLQTIDPAAEAAMGLKAFIGSYVDTAVGGLQLGGRMGGKAEQRSTLCAPPAPSPLTNGNNCRTGTNCSKIPELNTLNVVNGNPFHIGIGIAQNGLNQVLWAAYEAGALCLSIGGDSPALSGIGDFLNTSVVSMALNSLGQLTYGEERPIMLQLRPQAPPVTNMIQDPKIGTELDIRIPKLEIDFYTVVDNRYQRLFTLKGDITIPLGMKVENNEVSLAIGDLGKLIDPSSFSIGNVDMLSTAQVQTLVNMLGTIVSSLAGQALGYGTLPSFEIPEIEGFTLELVGPGLTLLKEGGQPAALGLFAKLGFADGSTGLRAALEPVITDLKIDMNTPDEMRRLIATRLRDDQPIAAAEVTPNITAHMAVMGADLADDDIEYAYSINGMPWSFWKDGPVLNIQDPILASQSKFSVRITARQAGNTASGSSSYASFDFVNDYTAPTVDLRVDGRSVEVNAADNVYAEEELTMQVRFNSGEWSDRQPIAPLEIPNLGDGHQQVKVDVIVQDPSGNARTTSRVVSVDENGDDADAGAQEDDASAGGCASGATERGGLLAIMAFFGLLMLRRRNPKLVGVAASSGYVSLAILAMLMFAFSITGCKSNTPGQGGIDTPGGETEGEPSDPNTPPDGQVPGDGHIGPGDPTEPGNPDEPDVPCTPGCESGEVCISGICVPSSCQDDQQCPGALICRNGVCKNNPNACVNDTDCNKGSFCELGECTKSECKVSAECASMTCGGDMQPYCDYNDDPNVEAGQCRCMRELPIGNYGSWLKTIQTQSGAVTALTFNETYGDLMQGTYESSGGFKWNFIDGVPSGPVVLAADGRRGGVKAEGDEAGRYVSVAYEVVDGVDTLHAAYQYVTASNGSAKLRYAQGRRIGGNWTWNFIDVDNEADAGMFPSIALLPNGGIGIAYMTAGFKFKQGNSPTQYFTLLSTAYSASRSPTSASSFRIYKDAEQSENELPCGGPCNEGMTCQASSNVCVACPSSDNCDSGKAVFTVVPQGLGLFTSAVADSSGYMHVSYYDQKSGVLKYMRLKPTSGELRPTGAPLIVDGQGHDPASGAVTSIGDVGRWTDIHLKGNDIYIFYEDPGTASLKAARVQGSNVHITLLDDGFHHSSDKTDVRLNRVGTAPVARESGGGYEVFYHDNTDGAVRRLMWSNLNAAPTEYPYIAFADNQRMGRDGGVPSAPADVNRQAYASKEGVYSFFTQVLNLNGKTFFSSKRISYSTTGRKIEMDVRTGQY